MFSRLFVLRNKSTQTSLAPPWQTWRSRLRLTTSSTRRSRRTTRSCVWAPLAARWHRHTRSPGVTRLLFQAAHSVCYSHFRRKNTQPWKSSTTTWWWVEWLTSASSSAEEHNHFTENVRSAQFAFDFFTFQIKFVFGLVNPQMTKYLNSMLNALI